MLYESMNINDYSQILAFYKPNQIFLEKFSEGQGSAAFCNGYLCQAQTVSNLKTKI